MAKSMTIERAIKLGACSEAVDWAKSQRRKRFTAKYLIANAPDDASAVDWTLWLLWRIDRPRCHRLRALCALHVLPIFEARYPNDQRPRKSIEAQIAYAANPTAETEKKMQAASAEAAEAAWAAWAARAAERKWQREMIARELNQ